MLTFLKKQKAWLIPVFVVIVLLPFASKIDLRVASYYYEKGSRFASNAFYNFLYDYGVVPAQITAILAFLALVMSYFSKKWRSWRAPALVLVLTMLVGAGFITQTLLKDHWGRPRPKQVLEFGGTQPFRPFYKPHFFGQPEPSKSFPCGHCSMGFYFFALALVGKRLHSKLMSFSGFFLAATLGVILSLARMSQGGHFFSDTVMSALIMWLTAYASDWLVYSKIK